jgi:hypothetical protein
MRWVEKGIAILTDIVKRVKEKTALNVFRWIKEKVTVRVAIIIMLITLFFTALGVIWLIARPVSLPEEDPSFEKLSVNAQIKGVSVNKNANTISALVERNSGQGNLAGFKFILMNETDIEILTTSSNIKESEEKAFILSPKMNVSTILSITLVPLIQIGDEEIFESVGKAYIVRTIPKFEPTSNQNHFQTGGGGSGGGGGGGGGGGCTPYTCSSLGLKCGFWSDGCDGTVNCGECDTDSGYSCTGGICQNSTNCTRRTCASLGYNCNKWSDRCGGTIDCGLCASGQDCINGRCQSAPSDPSLILWLKFDEPITDGIASDSSGMANHGTCSGSDCPVYLPIGGPGGTGAYEFNGVNDRIEINDKAIFGSMEELSVCLWVNIKSKGNWDYILSKSTNNFATSSYAIDLDDSPSQKITFGIRTSAGTAAVKTNTPELLNKWYHICGVYNGSELSIWEEGAKQLIIAQHTGPITDTSLPIKIGMANTSSYFNGIIDDVRIYNKSLAASEIQSIYEDTDSGCIPMTCADLGYNCGQANDGCNHLIDCGGCDAAAGYICIGGTCRLEPLCTPDCAGKQCGSDGCGDNSNCGTCSSGKICTSDNQCVTPTVTFRYVAKTGCSDSNDGTESKPWCTIQKAADTVSAGTTVYVGPGTYNERVTVSRSGASGNPITFKALNRGGVDMDGFYIKDTANYIKIEEFNISHPTHGIQNYGDYVEITDNYLYNLNGYGIGSWSGNHVIIKKNHITKVVIGMETKGTDILIEGNKIDHIKPDPDGGQTDYSRLFGTKIIVINNQYLGPTDGVDLGKDHLDCWQFYSTSQSPSNLKDVLIQNNTCLGNGRQGFIGRAVVNPQNSGNVTIRDNVIGWQSSWGVLAGNIKDVKIIHNTFVRITQGTSACTRDEPANSGYSTGAVIKNNIFADVAASYTFRDGADGVAGYNLLYNCKGSIPSHPGNIVTNPQFVDAAHDNYRLQSTSPACSSGEGGTYMGAYSCS